MHRRIVSTPRELESALACDGAFIELGGSFVAPSHIVRVSRSADGWTWHLTNGDTITVDPDLEATGAARLYLETQQAASMPSRLIPPDPRTYSHFRLTIRQAPGGGDCFMTEVALETDQGATIVPATFTEFKDIPRANANVFQGLWDGSASSGPLYSSLYIEQDHVTVWQVSQLVRPFTLRLGKHIDYRSVGAVRVEGSRDGLIWFELVDWQGSLPAGFTNVAIPQ
jgi:hypothetical protein